MRVQKNLHIAINQEGLLSVERDILPHAAEGEYAAVCKLLLILSEALRQAIPLTPGLTRFLAGALREIAYGGDAQAAFKIKRKRGEKDTRSAIERNVFLAFFVADLRRTDTRISVEDAIAKVAAEKCVPEETVKAAWRDYRHNVELRDSGAIVKFEKQKKPKE